jgi:hypothetical protein
MTTKKTSLMAAAGQPYLLRWTVPASIDVTTTLKRNGSPVSVHGAAAAKKSTPGTVTIEVTRDGKAVDFDGQDPVATKEGANWVFTAKVVSGIAGTNVYQLNAPGNDAWEETVVVVALTPFAAAKYPALETDAKDGPLQAALQKAVDDVAKPPGPGKTGMLGPKPVAFSMLCLTTSGVHRYAGVNDDKLHYSASLLKVAAMYAAHELLAAASRLARTPGGNWATPAAFFASMEGVFDAQIAAASSAEVLTAAKDLAAKLPAYRRTPSYSKIFKVTGAGGSTAPSVDFNPEFNDNMTKMIEVSDDDASGECIRRLSYSYIYGALVQGGFYTPGPPAQGIWLTGDYSNGAHPYARVNSENDKLVAQATTTKAMAQLFGLIALGKLVPQDGNNARMRKLLEKAAALGGWLFYQGHAARPFTLELTKIGLGNLKDGGIVYSEGVLLKWTVVSLDPAAKGLTGEFAACWQNLQIADFEGIVEVLQRTYRSLLA